eukprot:CAMPEP_0119143774 /NCGR_PEP_ID=MMETSP1310-20130426/34824_1 /TAXON_ID=464262 /ORGANISM="Genus nov. species nov., Strain RCC2339" /LENGTH=130 /DNA_ID=CAMNT_0007135437 /DNA_START=108 /DNA_END=497 /DNA_ORIENTATION=+
MALVRVSDEAMEAVNMVRTGKASFVVLEYVDDKMCEVADIGRGPMGSPQESWESFATDEHFPEDECRLGLVNFRYVSPTDKVERQKLALVHWAPGRSSMKARMVASFGLKGVKAQMGSGGISCSLQAHNL